MKKPEGNPCREHEHNSYSNMFYMLLQVLAVNSNEWFRVSLVLQLFFQTITSHSQDYLFNYYYYFSV